MAAARVLTLVRKQPGWSFGDGLNRIGVVRYVSGTRG